ncbi:hypothetical protein KFE25_000988 [Diacronema lutheri]|uniref:Uncharacterized protein n=1 Tax=Diacronema lutheri TaxID=2081491 RepID=A0A8J5XF33_DIALT|nr:hypothetical protein KFE25_000988 [Diacronema lutheri]
MADPTRLDALRAQLEALQAQQEALSAQFAMPLASSAVLAAASPPSAAREAVDADDGDACSEKSARSAGAPPGGEPKPGDGDGRVLLAKPRMLSARRTDRRHAAARIVPDRSFSHGFAYFDDETVSQFFAPPTKATDAAGDKAGGARASRRARLLVKRLDKLVNPPPTRDETLVLVSQLEAAGVFEMVDSVGADCAVRFAARAAAAAAAAAARPRSRGALPLVAPRGVSPTAARRAHAAASCNGTEDTGPGAPPAGGAAGAAMGGGRAALATPYATRVAHQRAAALGGARAAGAAARAGHARAQPVRSALDATRARDAHGGRLVLGLDKGALTASTAAQRTAPAPRRDERAALIAPPSGAAATDDRSLEAAREGPLRSPRLRAAADGSKPGSRERSAAMPMPLPMLNSGFRTSAAR